jgi:L,D-peptidoglycan transpeptidase YkuD (ErfK/YbiS/YcfS/YnhG family)
MAASRYVNRLRVHRTGREPHRGILSADGLTIPCALGPGGISARKREGDGASPRGEFPLRKLYFRPDRGPIPKTGLYIEAITPDLGWCDDPHSGFYNRPVILPFAASHEKMWRDDHLYDLVIVIGHNDAPPRKGFGSAIFLHLAREGFGATEGCVALGRDDLVRLLPRIGPQTVISIG